MHPILNHPAFRADFEQLREVTLNPERHTAPNALVHTELVAQRASALAVAHGLAPAETQTLLALAYVHDIGKIGGTARPVASVELLPRYDLNEERFVELVKYHDVNLPWWQSAQRGEPPSDKAWRKLAARVNVRLLCLFMVADRADCPGGWRNNSALVWFLSEAERRCLIGQPLHLEDADHV